MINNRTRAQQLLDRVYDRLEKIDIEKLSMDEMKDFLEVVQKGQFLETYGTVPQYGFGGLNPYACNTRQETGETIESAAD